MKIANVEAFPVRNFLAIGTLLLCASITFAQAGRGGISGLVTDQTGAIIAGADQGHEWRDRRL